MTDDDTEVYELTEEEDEVLWQRYLQVKRGDFVTLEELLAELRAMRVPEPTDIPPTK